MPLTTDFKKEWTVFRETNLTTNPHHQKDALRATFQVMADALLQIAADQKRLTDHLAPAPEDIVGTDYVARKLGCTQIWVARMAADGKVPKRCVVQGTGCGKTWKFYRAQVDEWLVTRNAHLTGQ